MLKKDISQLDDLDKELHGPTPKNKIQESDEAGLVNGFDSKLIQLPPDYVPVHHVKALHPDGSTSDLSFDKIPFKPLTLEAYDGSTLHRHEIPFPGLIDEIRKYAKYYGTKVLEEKTPAIIGQDIINIRALTGKARKNADKALRAAAEEMMDKASQDCFYVPHNVASSKNSKDIGFYLKKSQKTGKMEKVHVLVDSSVTKKYKKVTAGYWLKNKVEFLNQTRHLPLPLHIEFTFIRDSLRAFDMINAAQVCQDLMVQNGYFKDDESAYLVPVFNPCVFYHSSLAGVLFRVIK